MSASTERLAGDGVAADEVVTWARALEPERYYAALLAPALQRASLLAIAAFAADLRRIPSVVTEPMMGEIRLQWWRDTIKALGEGAAIGHSIADALGKAIMAHHLPLHLLAAMTEARAFDLYRDPMPDEAALDGYIAKTEAIPFALALRVLGVHADDADAIAEPAGRAFGLARILVSVPAVAADGRILLPEQRLQRAGVTTAHILSGVSDTALKSIFTEGCADIERCIAAVEPQRALLSRSERVGLLPLAAVPAYVRALRHVQSNAAKRTIEISPLARISRIAAAHYLGR